MRLFRSPLSNSIPGLADRQHRAAKREEELPKLGIDMRIAAVHQELDVMDDLQDGAAPFERSRRRSRAIAFRRAQ